MLCILPETSDPFFCLAAEEFLLKTYSEDIFMLWQSHDTVVVGKHQNAMAEIDYRYFRENGIRLARRISGGGTVFHDKGNVNFTFIKNVAGPQEISFKRFTQPIVDVLAGMGVQAETSGRNDLLVAGKKISGNAEHVFKNRVLHHGTLLYQSNLDNLGRAIRVIPGKYAGKAVQSNRSVVDNITGYLREPLSTEDFIIRILGEQLEKSADNLFHSLNASETEQIRSLSRQKFETWEWQFGYSPAYRFKNQITVKQGTLNIQAEFEKGRFTAVKIEGTCFSGRKTDVIQKVLIGLPHQYESVLEAYQEAGIHPGEDLIYAWF